jgi:hypothetical protein
MKDCRYNSLIFLLVALIFSTCNHKQQNNSVNNTPINRTDSILITYFCGRIETSVAIRCEKLAKVQEQHPSNISYFEEDGKLYLMPPELIDTFIVDKRLIDTVKVLLDKRIPILDFSEDARMYVTIKKAEGEIDHLCFDYNYFKNRVKYNGEACLIDDELCFLLRYYSGYYSWFDKSDLDIFNELKDSVIFQKVSEQIDLEEKNKLYSKFLNMK